VAPAAKLIAALLLALVYVFISNIGTTSVSVLGLQKTGAGVLTGATTFYFGNVGKILLFVIVFLACLTTSVGLVTACATYFVRLYDKISYKTYVVGLSLFSFAVGNYGLAAIIKGAVPVLVLLYPLTMVLILLGFANNLFGGKKVVYASTALVTGAYSLYTTIASTFKLSVPAVDNFLVKVLYNKGQTDNLSQTFGRFDFPVLANIPVIGDIFFKSTSLLGYIAIAFSFLAWFILFKTRFGLRLRSVGEHPQAADTLGINVYKMRYLGVVISGFLGGIGGAIYAQSISVNFSVTTIVGPGFIALAAMIFGKWNPIGAMLSSLFFGLSQSLAVIGSQLPFLQGVPAVYLQIAPYVLTILVLAAFFGKAVAPKADGINYIKSK